MPRTVAESVGCEAPWLRRDVVLDCLVAYFGDRAARPVDYLDKDWSAGVIHWAGTETASVWNGYMDGAVRSGHRAASEIHAALS